MTACPTEQEKNESTKGAHEVDQQEEADQRQPEGREHREEGIGIGWAKQELLEASDDQ